MASLAFRDVEKSLGSTKIIHGIGFDIADGEFTVLVGPSGCGKSTLLRMLAGLEEISGGTIAIDDHVVNDIESKDRDIAMVFQSYALYPHMTVADNMGFSLRLRKADPALTKERVAHAARILNLGPYLERFPRELSGGQRQRVAMGRALVRDPRIFLFDEPLSNLDAKLRVDMRTEIKRLHHATGTTIVYVTHDQIEAMTLATKIAVLKDGEVQQVGTPAEIYNRPTNLFVADFMGNPAMNLMEASIADGMLSLDRNGDNSIRLPVPSSVVTDNLGNGRKVILGIRPEAITDRDGADRNSRLIEIVESMVDVVEPAGSDTFVVTNIAGKEVIARMRADADVKAGTRMPFAFNLDKAVLFDPGSGLRL